MIDKSQKEKEEKATYLSSSYLSGLIVIYLYGSTRLLERPIVHGGRSLNRTVQKYLCLASTGKKVKFFVYSDHRVEKRRMSQREAG